jgi:hypothetical protein
MKLRRHQMQLLPQQDSPTHRMTNQMPSHYQPNDSQMGPPHFLVRSNLQNFWLCFYPQIQQAHRKKYIPSHH